MQGVHAARAAGGADHRAGRRPADRPDHGHRQLVQPVLDPPELSRVGRIAAARAAAPACRTPRCGRQLLSEEPSEGQLARLSQARQDMVGRWDRMYVMAGATPDYEPTPEKSIAAIAARGNSSPQEVVYDYLTEGLDRFLFFPIVNYADGDHAHGTRHADRSGHAARAQRRRRALRRDHRRQRALASCCRIGGATAAAAPVCRCRSWSRCRPARPPISSASATAAGFRPGLRADVNLIDFDRLRLHQPEVVQRPAGRRPAAGAAGRRLSRDPGRRHPGIRERPGHRRPPGPPGPRRRIAAARHGRSQRHAPPPPANHHRGGAAAAIRPWRACRGEIVGVLLGPSGTERAAGDAPAVRGVGRQGESRPAARFCQHQRRQDPADGGGGRTSGRRARHRDDPELVCLGPGRTTWSRWTT